ncbi:uncharacterized protein N7473_012496 [Penicillium subrubescens]|uniref:uncharacterized protein n=1 Tax=Penicillium subrubescens TaxID=1316194 RepID=UPI0025452B08|nr:uncharacterized protein N7473_012496 [Penicillium subrubescens]KAJ5875149.1 hypothetical protein N7473_012496 [Penicillium subrubescens]
MTGYQPNHPPETLGPFHPPKPPHSSTPPEQHPQPPAPPSAVVLVSGAGGGVSGPAGIYPSLADKIALLLSIPCLRLDYREPARTEYCVADMQAAFDYLRDHFGATHFVIVGWSFGGSPCFTVAAREPVRVAGVATIASQTAKTDGVRALSPRPMLLLHGEEDRVPAPSCSKSLFNSYGDDGDREMKLFPGDDHGLTRHAVQVEGKLLGLWLSVWG